MANHEEIAARAEELWRDAGEPKGRDVEFWLKAERQMAAGNLCVLAVGQCQFQESEALSGGRHIAHCKKPGGTCRNRAANHVT